MEINDIPFKLKKINAFKIKNPNELIEEFEGQTFFTKDDFETVEGIPKYYELDRLERTTGGIVLLSKYTLTPLINKKLKYPDPSNWLNTMENNYIFQRSHAIAYSLSAKKNDKINIFIGTEYANKSVMQITENDVKKQIKKNQNEKILYRVRLVYKDNEIIPRGILIEAKSKITNFEKCYYCYNVEKNVKFSYSNGKILEYKNLLQEQVMKIETIIQNLKYKKIKKIENTDSEEQEDKSKVNHEFILNRKTGIFHIEGCKNMNGIDPKYINEIRTSKKAMLKKFKPCSCTNKIK